MEWIFDLYDINRRGLISPDGLFRVIHSIYQLLGRNIIPPVDRHIIETHVFDVFKVYRIIKRILKEVYENLENKQCESSIFREWIKIMMGLWLGKNFYQLFWKTKLFANRSNILIPVFEFIMFRQWMYFANIHSLFIHNWMKMKWMKNCCLFK